MAENGSIEVMIKKLERMTIEDMAKKAEASSDWKKAYEKTAMNRRKLCVTNGEDVGFSSRYKTTVSFHWALNLFKSTFSNIRTLVLFHCRNFDETKLFLVGKYLRKLNNLWIAEKSISDDALKRLFRECKKLNRLLLEVSEADSSGKCFSSTPLVKHLCLSHFSPNNAIPEFHGRLSKTLESLDVVFTENLLKYPFANLASLRLDISSDASQFAAYLATLPKLHHLSLSLKNWFFSDQDIASLPQFPNIKLLELHPTFSAFSDQNDDRVSKFIAKFPSAEYLEALLDEDGTELKQNSWSKSVAAVEELRLLERLNVNVGLNDELLLKLVMKQSLKKMKIIFIKRDVISFITKLLECQKRDSMLKLTIKFVIVEGGPGWELEPKVKQMLEENKEKLGSNNLELTLRTETSPRYHKCPILKFQLLK